MAIGQFFSNLIKGLQGPYLRDYQHASRIFVDNNYAKVPKLKNWFHVYFEITDSVKAIVNNSFQKIGLDYSNRIFFDPQDMGLVVSLGQLVRSVKLPEVKFDTKKHNLYNKWSHSVTKVNYEPVSVEFHDDSQHLIRSFWQTYYHYMVQDSRYVNYSDQASGLKIPQVMTVDSIPYDNLNAYYPDSGGNFGLDTVFSESLINDKTTNFFKAIRIYHFSRNVNGLGSTYAEYVLVNPIITNFVHDTLDYTSSEFVKCSMNFEYEHLLYNKGIAQNADGSESGELPSWSKSKSIAFDKSKSPLENPKANLFGKSGLLQTSAKILDMTKSGDILGAAVTATQSVAAFKDLGTTGIKNAAVSAAIGGVSSIVVPKISGLGKVLKRTRTN